MRGRGHSPGGFEACDGGLVIDLSEMKRVEVDAEKRMARAEAGALVCDVDQATQHFGSATQIKGGKRYSTVCSGSSVQIRYD